MTTQKDKRLRDYAPPASPSLKQYVKNKLRACGYAISRTNIKPHQQSLHPVTPDHFFDLYFSMIDKTSFFFVQVGANDGKTRDFMYPYIEKYQLSGLVVEPLPNVFEKLRESHANHPNIVCANVAIAKSSGTFPFFVVKENLINDRNFFETTAIASLEKENIKHNIKKRIPHVIERVSDNLDDYIDEIEIPTMTPATLLKEHNVEHVDFLFTDCEGYDGEVIKLIDFKTLRPKMIKYESVTMTDGDRDEVETLLASNGYHTFRAGNDTCAFLA